MALRYTRSDYEQILRSLDRVMAAVDDAIAALAAGDVDRAAKAIDVARSEMSNTIGLFPVLVVNDETTLPFREIYPDLYEIDLLIMIAFQWPDTSPTSITEMKELVDAFGERLANLRQWRAQPWGAGAEVGLSGLDGLIAKTDELRGALDALVPRARLDPRKYTWLGQDFKATFLNGVGDTDQLGTMYTFLFPIDHAIERARWSVANRKLAGANRRLVESKRLHGLFSDWFRQNEPSQ